MRVLFHPTQAKLFSQVHQLLKGLVAVTLGWFNAVSANRGVPPLFENCISLWLCITIPGCELLGHRLRF